ncbi:MAG TPA: ABC transporter permease [Gemmatimonadaceae bacterium]|jgi:predicted permease
MRRALRLIFRRAQIAEAVDDELAFHLDMRTQRLIACGMAPEAARREALRQFGDIDSVRSDCVTFDEERERTMRRRNYSEELRQDIAYAIRTLRRNAGFSLVVVLTLALGIGANTAIFTLIDSVLLRPLEVPRPEQLVAIGNPSRTGGVSQGGPRLDLISYPMYQTFQQRATMFQGMLASGRVDQMDLVVDGRAPEHPRARYVSGNYFRVLGVPVALGRPFGKAEDAGPGASPVIVISYDYWMRRFAGDRSVIGKKLSINDVPMTVIGVAREGYRGEIVGTSYDVWLPITMQPVLAPHGKWLDDWTTSWLLLLGRLVPGATVEQAHAAMTPIARQAFLDHVGAFRYSPPANIVAAARTDTVPVSSGSRGFSRVRRDFHEPLLILMAGVGLLLLIVCANVANLLLARAVARGREMAVRLALGSGRARLVRQLLTESLILGLLGAAGGLLVASWGSRLLVTLAADGGTIPLDLSADLPVLGFTLLLSLAAVAFFGLAPALRASRIDLATTMRAQSRALGAGFGTATGRRMPIAKLLIVGQVALSVVLLTGAALLVRSLRALENQPMGLDREHLLIVDIPVGERGYVGARRGALVMDLASRFGSIPGVEGVSYSENGIFSGTESESDVSVEGFTARSAQDSASNYDQVGPRYAAAIGARVLQGRDMAAQDGEHGRVALVNESFARFYFRDRAALGKFFRADTVPIQIVGVINDVRDHTDNLRTPPARRFYLPYLHPQDEPIAARFEIRTRGEPARIGPEVRRIVSAADAHLSIDIDPLTVLVRSTVREERLLARLALGFGLGALLLAAIGLYGVMTYSVTRRTAEIGLRVALGAQREAVIGLVVGDALRVVLIGFVVGLPVALGALRLLGAELHGVEATDPLSIATALSVLLVSAVVAVLLPAFRASRVSPIVALREE